jgi:hypothetical protein
MPDVILFRTPTPTDTYPALLSAAGYSSTSVAALTDEISTAQLAPILVTGARQWEGAIVTSRRAADAWVRAVGGIEEQRGSGVLVGSTGAPVSDGGSAFGE